jgi:hypothetical protein
MVSPFSTMIDARSIMHVLQFANVASPGMGLENADRFRAQAGTWHSHGRRRACQKWSANGTMSVRRSVRAGNSMGNAASLKKILAKISARRSAGQIHIAGGQYAYVHARDFGGTQALNFFLLQKPQQLGLHPQGKFTDLIEK